MEHLLSGFQTDLGKISSEIQTLQEDSASMNVRLKNRVCVQNPLNNILEGIVISPSLIRSEDFNGLIINY